MESYHSPLKAIDLSQSMFRGSGALYQTDRLTTGRTKAPIVIAGQDQVIEKIVHVQDETALRAVDELKGRLREACLRLVLLSMDNRKLAGMLAIKQRNSAEVFENQLVFDNEQLKTEVSRLNQCLSDKEKEIQYVKEAEIRKSAIQSGDLTMRLQVAAQENKRLQDANVLRISQINEINSEMVKVKREATLLTSQLAQSSNSGQLETLLAERDVKIKVLEDQRSKLSAELSSERGYKESLGHELSGVKLQMVELNNANEDLFRINQYLEKEIESMQVHLSNAEDMNKIKEDNHALQRRLDDLQVRNLEVREELARQAVAHTKQEEAIKAKFLTEIQTMGLKLNEKEEILVQKGSQITELQLMVASRIEPQNELPPSCEECAQYRSQIQSERKRLESLSVKHREELQLLTSQLDVFKRELDSQTQSASASQRKIEKEKMSILNSLNDYKIQVSNLQHSLEEKDQQLAKLQQTEKTMTYEIKELSKFIKEYTGSKEADTLQLKAELNAVREQLNSARSEGSRRQIEDQQNYSQELRSRDRQIEELRVGLDAAQHQVKLVSEGNSKLIKSVQIESAGKEEAYIQRVREKDEEISSLKQSLTDAHSLIDKKESEKVAEIAEVKLNLQKEISNIREDLVKESQSTAAGLQSIIEEDKIKLSQLQTNLDACLKDVRRLENEKHSLENRVASIEAAKAAKEESLSIQVKGLEKELQAREKELGEERINKRNVAEEGSKRQLGLESDKIMLENELAKTKEILRNTTKQAEKLPELDSQIADLIASLNKVTIELDQKKETLKAAQANIEESGIKVQESLEKEESLRIEADQIKDELARRELDFINIQTELERVNSLLEMAESSIQDKDRRLVDALKQNNDLQGQARRFHDMLEQSEAELSRLTSQTTNQFSQLLSVENQQLKSQLQSMAIEFDNYRAARFDGLGVDNNTTGRSEAGGNNADLLKLTVRQLTADRDRLYGELKAADDRRQTLERDNFALKSELRDHQRTHLGNGAASNDPRLLKEQYSQLEAHQKITSSQLLFEREEFEKQKQKQIESEMTIAGLRDEIRAKSDECESLKRKVIELRETAEELIDDYKANEEVQIKYKNAYSEIKLLTRELESVKKRHEEDKKDLKKRVEHNKKLTEAYEKQRSDYQTVMENHYKSLQECGQLKEELLKLKEKTRGLETQLQEPKS